ncbi:MAG: histidine phosphatase family protein [Hydrogenophaga sp.]|uniref:histidine phosphatase family protein n=1 Tax=Hydrogenophaga sp. TaxID=1904254 RepID=UPI002777F7EC|nr:histidine phosphatase family protein [Hydrogenophaga sp.]MDP2418624.1 histidine phosphatase family protein [Hydrogenophaga sp.]MDZ4188076.1 histidine phosphatase family protein [Hydrogenophaga sp.]
MKLWLLRHAQVDLPAGLCYGASDVPAHAALTLQAAQAAAKLLPVGLPVWVSALGRAQALAQALQQLRPDLGPPSTDPRLNEMNFGCWELQPWDAVPRSAFDVWMADFAHHRFGGAESTQQVIDRVAQALQSLRAAQVPEAVWVTHAGVIRAVQFVATQGAGPLPVAIGSVDQWPTDAPAPGGHLCIDW